MTTRDEIAARAAEQGLRPLQHDELELDARNGGCAFEDDADTVWIFGYDGSWGRQLRQGRGIDTIAAEWLAHRRHANRQLDVRELGVWQQAAVAAAEDGSTVSALRLGLDAADTDYAEYLRILVGRSPAGSLRAFASTDYLLEPPQAERRYTHPCPLCASPALHTDRYPSSVCDACYARTTDSTGRLVTGANVELSGGFVAHFAGTSEICTEVTARKRCYIDGIECRIDEAHLGGVVVEAL